MLIKREITIWERWAVCAILAIALALRLYKLDSSLWFDEVMTLGHYVRRPVAELIADYSSFNNHLFYSLQARALVWTFGEQVWALRAPAVVFGVASIWVLWRLARTMLEPVAALAAAALLALSYHHIWFSQNARGYTELMFWCLLALLVFVRALGGVSRLAWIGFAACLAAAMYTHLTAAFFIAALGLAYAAMLAMRWLGLSASGNLAAPAEPRAQAAPVVGFVLGGVFTLALCAPAIPQMLSQVGAVKGTSAVDPMQEYQSPLWAALEGLRTLGGSDPLVLAAAPAALAVAALGAVVLFRRNALVVTVGVLHIVLTLAALLAVHMRIWPRFFFTDIAFVLLFIAAGADELARWLATAARRLRLDFATAPRLFAAGAAVMFAASGLLAARNYAVPKQDLSGAVQVLAEAGAAPESVGAIGLASEVYALWPQTAWPAVKSAADLQGLRPTAGRRWAVLIFEARTSRDFPGVMQTLDRDFHLLKAFPGTLGDGAVLVYESKPPPV
jgi:hypothetical protein